MHINHLLLFLILLVACAVPGRAQPGGPCDSLGIVAAATATPLTCSNPVATLTGVAVPNATGYGWTGPGGFAASQRVAQHWVPGTYTFTVYGPLGCTDQTTVTVIDSCTDYPLTPEACANLNIPIPADECSDACVVPCLEFVPGSSAAFTPSGTVTQFCGTIENDQYFAFVAYSPVASFVATPANCILANGIQLAVYEQCSGPFLACSGGEQGGGNTPIILTVNNLTVGKAYYLLIDGYAGDECDFILEQTMPQCEPDTIVAIDTSILVAQYGSDTICIGGSLTYTASMVGNANAYLWTAPSDAQINLQPSPRVLYVPDGTEVTVTAGVQDGFVCRRALYFFGPPGPPVCRRLVTVNLPVTVLPDVLLCNEDLPYVLPWGQVIGTPGIYQTTLQSYQGCDSVVRIKVVVKPPLITNLGLQTVCTGDCIQVGNTTLCSPGNHNVVLTSYQGCDSTVNVSLLVLAPNAEISGPLELTCAQPSVVLVSPQQSGVAARRWRDAQGMIIGTSPTLPVSQPGTYILEVIQQAGGVMCTATDTVVVTQNVVDVEVTASAGMLDCTVLTAPISATGNLPGLSFTWTGPAGFVAAVPDTAVTQPGNYTVIATDPATGCSAVASIDVTAGSGVPDVLAVQSPTICGDTLLLLMASSTVSGVTYAWSGPNGFTADQADVTVVVAGAYTVTVTTPAGCQASAVVLAEVAPAIPVIALTGTPVVLTCLPPTASLTVSSTPPATSITWLGANGNVLGTGAAYALNSGLPAEVMITTADGCTATEGIEYLSDVDAPNVMATGAILTCALPTATLTAMSSTPGVSFVWMGLGGVVNGPSVTVDAPGLYTVLVTALNGCTATTTVEVIDSCTTSVPMHYSGTDLRVYPNASTGVFFVETAGPAPSAIEQLDVYAADGRLVVHRALHNPVTTYRLDLQLLPVGHYRLAVRSAGRWQSVPLVIAR